MKISKQQKSIQPRPTRFHTSWLFSTTDWRKRSFTHTRRISSTRSITSKALILSTSKLITGTDEGLLIGKGSLLISLVGEWLLLLVSLWCLLNLFRVSNSWLLLIPGVNFRLLTSRSISRSSDVSPGSGELGLFVESWSPIWFGERIGDLTGDLIPPFIALDCKTRWWSHTINSRIHSSVFSLSAWWRVSIRNESIGQEGFRFASDLQDTN